MSGKTKICPVCGTPQNLKSERSLRRHRFFFALINLFQDALEEGEYPSDPERFRYWVTVSCGFYDHLGWYLVEQIPSIIQELAGKKVFFIQDGNWIGIRKARSIAFKAMNDDEFGKLVDKAIDLAVKHIGSAREEIRAELAEICGVGWLENVK